MAYWEAYTTPESSRSDPAEVMSTDPEATRDNFPRDMQWGQVSANVQADILSAPVMQGVVSD